MVGYDADQTKAICGPDWYTKTPRRRTCRPLHRHRALEEKYGLAPGMLGRDAPAGKDAKAPSVKKMKATIRKAGFGVADLVEKSDVVKRYQEALARLGK